MRKRSVLYTKISNSLMIAIILIEIIVIATHQAQLSNFATLMLAFNNISLWDRSFTGRDKFVTPNWLLIGLLSNAFQIAFSILDLQSSTHNVGWDILFILLGVVAQLLLILERTQQNNALSAVGAELRKGKFVNS